MLREVRDGDGPTRLHQIDLNGASFAGEAPVVFSNRSQEDITHWDCRFEVVLIQTSEALGKEP